MTPPWTIEQLLPWIELRFDRSSGPGGQHVNKVSTRVSLLFDFAACTELSATIKRRIRERLSTRIDRDSRLRIVRQQARSQLANRVAAEEFLIELLETMRHTPRQRIATRPTRASQRRRVENKRQHGDKKRQRRPPRQSD